MPRLFRNIIFIREIVRDFLKIKSSVTSGNENYIDNGIKWICSAQDSSKDKGVARAYSLRDGWEASYPEITGYTIPTIFDYAYLSSDENLRERSLQMADWLLGVQLPCGGIQAGTIDVSEIVPTIFNTGQVLFGWVRAYEETLDKHYLDAIVRGADWLIQMQDEDGAWRKGGSPFVSYNINCYNTRTAWSLLCANKVAGKPSYKRACLKNLKWALSQQNHNGWFNNNCLAENSIPFLHTIAYTIRGILEIGIHLEMQEFIEAAHKTADKLIMLQRPDGSLAGRLNENWCSSVSWSCLTGDAQIAVIWLKLYQLNKEQRYLKAARSSLHFLKSTVNLKARNKGIRGGVKGSYPIWGQYNKFKYPSWAVKFFVDALILESNCRDNVDLP